MKINLAQEYALSVTPGPYRQLSTTELDILIDNDTDTLGFDVTAETCSLTIDISSRYRLDTFVYYRTTATTENLVVYGRQGTDGHVWEELISAITSDRVVVNFSDNVGKFQEVKVVHTVTAGTSTVFEIELWSSEEFLGFGATGNISVYSLDSGTENLTVEEIQLYNGEELSTKVFCAIDTSTDNYLGLSLAATPSGTFYSAYENSIELPGSYPWSSGSFNNVEQTGTTVTLVTGTYGFYYTPVLDIESLDGRRFFWESTVSGSNRVGTLPENTTIPTVSVRFSDTEPSDLLWAPGELSSDSLWSTISGTLPFTEYTNNTLVPYSYKKFFQARVELSSPAEGQTPILTRIGVESNVGAVVAARASNHVYAKSKFDSHTSGRNSGLITWSPNNTNKN